jgi:hypothetical protein
MSLCLLIAPIDSFLAGIFQRDIEWDKGASFLASGKVSKLNMLNPSVLKHMTIEISIAVSSIMATKLSLESGSSPVLAHRSHGRRRERSWGTWLSSSKKPDQVGMATGIFGSKRSLIILALGQIITLFTAGTGICSQYLAQKGVRRRMLAWVNLPILRQNTDQHPNHSKYIKLCIAQLSCSMDVASQKVAKAAGKGILHLSRNFRTHVFCRLVGGSMH